MHVHTYASHACCFLLWGGGRLIEAAADICYLRTRSFFWRFVTLTNIQLRSPLLGGGRVIRNLKHSHTICSICSALCVCRFQIEMSCEGFDKYLRKIGSATTICLSPWAGHFGSSTFTTAQPHRAISFFPPTSPRNTEGPPPLGGRTDLGPTAALLQTVLGVAGP